MTVPFTGQSYVLLAFLCAIGILLQIKTVGESYSVWRAERKKGRQPPSDKGQEPPPVDGGGWRV